MGEVEEAAGAQSARPAAGDDVVVRSITTVSETAVKSQRVTGE